MGPAKWVSTILLVVAPLVPGQLRQIPPPDRDPFVGEWKADAAKSRPKLDRVEASYERMIRRDGDYLVFASVGGASKAAVRQFRIRCDGLEYPLRTGPFVLSCRYAATNRVEGETKGKQHSFWTREVSLDGQEMTISEYKDKGRTKLGSVIVLDRVK